MGPFPKHLGGLIINHDPHRANYETVQEWSMDGFAEWLSDEDREKAISEDSFWTVQWYPETPIGFYVLAGTDLDALLAEACKISPAAPSSSTEGAA